ncbi:MAG TPA: Smr/MutS family protein [Xanthobacteraceae bacterium]|nr:Smr/MutS family protein [Xanthobacteraceae bacterium]
MTSDERKPRRPRRALTADEHALWSHFTRSIAPLRRRRPLAPESEAVAEETPVPARPLPPAPVARAATPHPPPRPPGLAPIDRRLKQKLARGREAIDRTIDLHGLTQAQAHTALVRFLRMARAEDARMVLVITGKGARSDDFAADRGVLRRQVPLWLRSAELRDTVVGFDWAHAAHGGEGALYVRIRRRRE